MAGDGKGPRPELATELVRGQVVPMVLKPVALALPCAGAW